MLRLPRARFFWSDWIKIRRWSLALNLAVCCLFFGAAMNDCLFCKIISGEIPSKKVREDEYTFAFEDIDPKAPTHVLIVPKKHLRGLKEAGYGDAEIIGRCHLMAAEIARERKIEDSYRTVLNVGPGSGQSVFHLHVHLLGGRNLHWPPG